MHIDRKPNQSSLSNRRLSEKYRLIVFVIGSLAINRVELFAAEVKLDEQFSTAFKTLDTNNDRKLSSDEFCANRQEANVAKRDFQVFDLNRDGFLSLAEFASIPDAVPGLERGPISDPLVSLVNGAVAEMDKSYHNWNENPETEFQRNRFVQPLRRNFTQQQITFDLKHVEEDNNGNITRAEARRYVEIELSVRNGSGVFLHKPNGQIINYNLFLHIDANRNGSLDRKEFSERSFSPGNPDAEFDAANRDGNDSLSVEEFGRVPLRGVNDPIIEFRKWDTDLDGFVSRDELVAGRIRFEQRWQTFVDRIPTDDASQHGAPLD
jgi:Ca2+-binding EF-hand superfamily protein